MNIKRYFFQISVLALLLVSVAASYYRFMVLEDFQVSYEGECDPATESCFVDCADDDCEEEYYYTEIERNAAEIKALCGEDITDCPAANFCPAELENCTVTFCDTEVDGEACENITINTP